MSKPSALKISQLRAFVVTAHCGNFTLASLELGLSQSTVSHAIATLEADLGVVLMNRGRYGAALTAIGQEILADAEQVLRLLDAITTKANADRGLQSGQVRLASVRSVATHLLPKVIAQFRHDYPQVQVRITEYSIYADVEQAVRDGQADIGFTLLPTGPALDIWDTFRDEFVVLLPPNSLMDDEPLTWEALSTLPIITTPALPPHRHMRTVMEHLEQFGQSLNVVYEVSQDSTVTGMVQQGLGASILARLAAEPIPPEIQVRSLPVPLERVMAIALPADTLLSRAPFAFLSTLKPVFQHMGLMPASNSDSATPEPISP
ncbi:MAG: LysR family transcriptional regulator [Kaiparowitsia implicata GSE-PSE-MK54-09C]|jgi:DNA-binding transcriptional LysR family regulator|nr:LysR family transcriptional regulator [Kaiparowitsia implicata GSE-PSE-MK54-09C]